MEAVAEQNIIEKFGIQTPTSQSIVDEKKKAAIQLLADAGLPNAKDEEYKFTNVTKLLSKGYQPLINSDLKLSTSSEQPLMLNMDAHILVFNDGKFSRSHSSADIEGCEIKTFQEALISGDEDLFKHYGKASGDNKDPFLALNTAMIEDILIIKVSKNTKVTLPISIVHNFSNQDNPYYINTRLLVMADQGSEVTLVEEFHSGDTANFTNMATEIILEENANVHYYKIQNDNAAASQLSSTQVLQARSSRFSAYTFTLNGQLIRNNLSVKVQGTGCETNMYGLYLVDGKTHVDNHTSVDHIEPHCESNELYKGILDDTAKGVFNGKVFVRKEAQKTNAFQSNKNILLTDDAVINTKPQLEIWADDVKCSHGCTTGQLNEDALFYLRARGLSKQSARALLLHAFAVEVLEQVHLEELKIHLEKVVSKRLRNGS